MKKVIITGGAGFIGTSLVKALLDNDIEKILIIDDLSTGSKSNLDNLLSNKKIEFIESRIEDINNIDELFENYDFCYHLAAGVGVQYIMDNLSESLLTNILATHKVLEACQVNNLPVLLTSTSEVYGVAEDKVWTEETKSLIGPTTKLRWSYAASKMIDEFIALSLYEEGKISPIIVRLFNIIGPNQLSKYGMVVPRFIEAAVNDEDILIHGDGSQSRSFTWVDDVVTYLIKLAELKAYGEIFNIGQTEEITIEELAKLIIEKSNSNSKIIFKSHEEVFGKSFEDPKRRTPGIDKIVEFTGIQPSKNIEFMIENIINHKQNS
ncbi:MAG: NAD-dependent epimerase/dehydratase family protein [Candidatus Actinomarina sp.]|jgi:UDP-glucose 4-epimerase|tara:strand:+ start:506 stop:1471 length:966 start_codon:yes stop_codon:yes gene_type:complete